MMNMKSKVCIYYLSATIVLSILLELILINVLDNMMDFIAVTLTVLVLMFSVFSTTLLYIRDKVK